MDVPLEPGALPCATRAVAYGEPHPQRSLTNRAVERNVSDRGTTRQSHRDLTVRRASLQSGLLQNSTAVVLHVVQLRTATLVLATRALSGGFGQEPIAATTAIDSREDFHLDTQSPIESHDIYMGIRAELGADAIVLAGRGPRSGLL